MVLTSRMMKKGEEARACSVSFSSKALTMGVLKRSRAAMIVLLLFFASLPGAKGVKQGTTQSPKILDNLQNTWTSFRGNFPHPEFPSCGIPSHNGKAAAFGEGGVLRLPAAVWFTKAVVQGVMSVKEDSIVRNPLTLPDWNRRRKAGQLCNRQKAVNEIAMKADAVISVHNGDTEALKNIFHELIHRVIYYNSLQVYKVICVAATYIYNENAGACTTLVGLQVYMSQIVLCRRLKNDFCIKLLKIYNSRKQAEVAKDVRVSGQHHLGSRSLEPQKVKAISLSILDYPTTQNQHPERRSSTTTTSKTQTQTQSPNIDQVPSSQGSLDKQGSEVKPVVEENPKMNQKKSLADQAHSRSQKYNESYYATFG